jgi:hypothetical protein
MNKIKRILIGAGMLALSGNAAAIIMNGDGSKTFEYSDYADLIQDVIAGMYNDTAQDERRSARVAKKQHKVDKKLLRLATADLSNKVESRVSNRVSRLQTQIANILTKMDIMAKLPDSVVLALNGGDCGESARCDDDNGSVPEPSTIALLGLGLVGIGVARRLRKKAR